MFLASYRFGRYDGRDRDRTRGFKATQQLRVVVLVVLVSGQVFGQETPNTPPAKSLAAKNPWAYNLTVDGYIVPEDQSYVDPVFSANRSWLHLDVRGWQ